MKPTKLPLSSIVVLNRQRLDLGDIDDLAASMKSNGLIQPIVINQDHRLIAGGRRFAAATKLGWTEIPVVFRETMTEDELHVLELEENIRRKDETWQEKCLHIQTIHKLKSKLKALDLESWGQRETGAMLGVSVGHINYCLVIASKLQEELSTDAAKRKFWNCDSLAEAWRLWMRNKEDALLAELAKRQQVSANTSVDSSIPTVDPFGFDEIETPLAETLPVDEREHILSLRQHAKDNYLALTESEARTLYLSNALNKPEEFEQYYKEKREQCEKYKLERNTIYLSRTLHNGDSIAFMNQPANHERFDHIITDIPYGIDMKMLNQQNPHGGMNDIDTVEELHDVEYNLKLISDFFPAAFHCTKPQAFVITWGDQMLWQYMYDCAIKAGFAVQRWPITWYKQSSCMNQCASYNFTKDTEIAIVCRKPSTTLAQPTSTCVISAGRDDLCEAVGHPFAKPFEVWKFLTEAVSIQGQLILEPFMGRGSGVISMLRLNRRVFGVELDTAHFNAALENIKSIHYLPLNPEFIFK